jgi:hypothetical protein
MNADAEHVAAAAEECLALREASLIEEYFYNSVAHCVLDAVYSISARYESTRLVVIRYCQHLGIPRLRTDRRQWPTTTNQQRLSSLITIISDIGPESFATNVVRNRQRTSTRSGILKAEAVLDFATVLQNSGVEFFQDLLRVANNAEMDRQLREIRGMASGVAIQYFWMLAGIDDLVKPDRMVRGFLYAALGREVEANDVTSLLQETTVLLRRRYPNLTPRLLDYQIWQHQRAQQA